jgi:hypothetical protein
MEATHELSLRRIHAAPLLTVQSLCSTITDHRPAMISHHHHHRSRLQRHQLHHSRELPYAASPAAPSHLSKHDAVVDYSHLAAARTLPCLSIQPTPPAIQSAQRRRHFKLQRKKKDERNKKRKSGKMK